MVIGTGWIAPAPRPCSTRKNTSASIDRAAPQPADAKRKSPMPAANTGRLPCASASFPQVSTPSVDAIRKAENTHEYAARPPRLAAIEGIAPVTPVPSNAATTRLRTMAAVATRRRAMGSVSTGSSAHVGATLPAGNYRTK